MPSSTSNFRRALPAVVVSMVLIAVTAFVGVVQFGYSPKGEPTEPWLSDVAQVRETLYASSSIKNKQAEPTIWVVSGSNGLFSLASDVLAEHAGHRVRNYSLHAGLHTKLLLSQIRGKTRPGDLVVAPLEFGTLDRELGNRFDTNNYIHHFHTIANLTAIERYQLLSAVPLRRWLKGLLEITSGNPQPLAYPARSADSLARERGTNAALTPYSHRALTDFGDINVEGQLTRDTWLDGSSSFPPGTLGQNGVNTLRQWQAELEAQGVSLVVVSPVILQSVRNQILSRNAWLALERIRATMSESGVPLHCDPVNAVFAAIYRFNTLYHMNAAGARLRSAALGQCVANFLAGKKTETEPIDVDQVIDRVRARLDAQKQNFGVGNLPVQIRLRDITKMHRAILAYADDENVYPPSSSGDGWGLPEGLVPKYLARLPIDPKGRANSGKDPHYAYWSNGKDYKVVAVVPAEDCTFVSANWPEMIDPWRVTNGDPTQCGAVGYWTENSKNR